MCLSLLLGAAGACRVYLPLLLLDAQQETGFSLLLFFFFWYQTKFLNGAGCVVVETKRRISHGSGRISFSVLVYTLWFIVLKFP